MEVYIDCHLDWSVHTDAISSKLSREIGMLAKIRHYVETKQLRSIYFAIFSSIMTYGSIIWGQTANISVKRIQIIQNKAIRIINFSPFNSPTAILYRKSNILKFSDYVKLQNFLLVHDNLNKRSSLIFFVTDDGHNLQEKI